MQLNNDASVAYGKTQFKYISPSAIKNALKPLLEKHRLFLHFTVSKVEELNLATLTISDLDDDTLPSEIYTMLTPDILLNNNSIQGAGGLRTYMLRYLCLDAFLIADNTEDLEGKTVTDRRAATNHEALSHKANSASNKQPLAVIDEKVQSEILDYALNQTYMPKQALLDFCKNRYGRNNFLGLPLFDKANILKFVDVEYPNELSQKDYEDLTADEKVFMEQYIGRQA